MMMKMSKGFCVLACVITAACAGVLGGCAAPEDSGKLVVAMELAYPPFETKDAQGNPTGVSVDFANAIGEYIGKETVIQNTSWDGLIPSLSTGKADLVISSMTITQERSAVVDFSTPYANALLGILANADSTIEKAEDLNVQGAKIAVKIGSTGYIYAQENLSNAQIIALADESACVTEVSQGKADAFIYDQLTIYRNHELNPDTTKAIYIPFQEPEKWGVAVKKGNTQLLEKVNEFIEAYTKDGGFDALSEKYLKEEKKAFDELGFEWFFDV